MVEPRSSGTTILVIDDEPQIRRLVRNALDTAADKVSEAATGRAGLDIAAAERPQLVVLDLNLPDADGLDVCRDLRAFTPVPILVLSARFSDRDKAALLDAGADDYLTKPFSTIELQARVRALLRRATPAGDQSADRIVAGDLEINIPHRTVSRGGVPIHLTPTEWSLLRALIANAGRTMTHRQLFHSVWGRSEGDAQQYLRVYVGQLRRKLEKDPVRPVLIRTEPAVGYRFELES
ncbi:MAG TPA: response regulator transcription factor [Gemmatimonadaceae bacterium]|nr:response regulator transcription factor [Gemmatimonadaceae bacterium]